MKRFRRLEMLNVLGQVSPMVGLFGTVHGMIVAFQTIAGYYWDETRGDSSLTEAQKREYIGKGLEAVDKALSLKADYVEALTFKGLLLRLQANVEKDGSKQQQLLKEATELSDRANELRKKATGN